jgi:hypothetical protein
MLPLRFNKFYHWHFISSYQATHLDFFFFFVLFRASFQMMVDIVWVQTNLDLISSFARERHFGAGKLSEQSNQDGGM